MEPLKHGDALVLLKDSRTWALVGASQKPGKYAYQLLQALRLMGKTVLPVNPSYSNIDALPCYPDIASLSAHPDVLVFTMAPPKPIEQIRSGDVPTDVRLWFPPNCFDEDMIRTLRSMHYSFVYDLCPIGLGMEAGLLKEKP